MLLEEQFPEDWASTWNNLGNAYSNLPTGNRIEDLAKAIACYETALRVYSEEHFPQVWATIEVNLAMAFNVTGKRAEAVKSWKNAIRGYRRIGMEEEASKIDAVVQSFEGPQGKA